MENDQCRICRKLGTKLFLKGQRCFGPKCAVVRKPYRPGEKSKKSGKGGASEYGKELAEKQKLKNWYNLRERQFSAYVKKAIAGKSKKKGEDAGTLLMRSLEMRLDNVVFRLGFADSRRQARDRKSVV